MDCTVRAMTCRFGACCSSALNCPWWHSAEEIKIFKDEVELQKRKLAVRCGFCARGECRFGEDCKRAKRVGEIVGMRAEPVAPTDSGDDVCAGAGGETTDAAEAVVRVGGSSDEKATKGGETRYGGVGTKAVDGPFVFGRRRVGVVRRPSAVEEAGGVGGAGAFGALASRLEEREEEEEEVDITFSLPKPKEKVKEKRKEKAAVKVAVGAAERAAESDSGAAEAAAVAAVTADGKLRDFEVLSVWSNHIDKTSEAAEKATEKVAEKAVCPMVAAMLAVGTAEASDAVEAKKEKVAAVHAAAEEAATTEDQRFRKGQRIETKGLLRLKAAETANKKKETVEEQAERLRKSLAQSMW